MSLQLFIYCFDDDIRIDTQQTMIGKFMDQWSEPQIMFGRQTFSDHF